ncbi:MAG: hypothetical protein AAF514_17145 [Verrucomicrobiota bacterium]
MAFGQNPESSPIEVKDFEAVTPFVGENKEGATERIVLELLNDETMETVETLAHVAGFNGEEDFEAAGKAEHVPGG